mgnify:CR=1 FL=1
MKRCVEEIPVELAKRCANKGWFALCNAEPVLQELRRWETAPRMGNPMMVHWLTGEALATRYEEALARQNQGPQNQQQPN